MARTTRRFPCAERAGGCREHGFYEFDTQREAREYDLRYSKDPWRCARHSKPDEVLSADNATRVTVLTAERSTRYPDLQKLFWREEGHDDVGSGFTHGPGFKAWANDFPEGTRLVITAALAPAAERGPAQVADESEGS